MKKTVFRIVSIVMLFVACIFLVVALSHPELGRVFYIGELKIGSEIWRAFYVLYALVMVGLFVASFFVDKAKAEKND
ncbi:MAG: hypothetical protein J6B60_02300 [Clostridia bacterium]|nr:hypothetical protein [Clostridia bacterium]